MTKKEMCIDFLQLCAKGDSRKAFSKYTLSQIIHHNAYFKGDAESLIVAMEEEAVSNPTKIFEVYQTLEEGDRVAVHSLVRNTEEDLGYVVVHLFRFEDDRIIEMWDLGQEVPENMVNKNGMF